MGRAPTLADVSELSAFLGACAAADGVAGPDADEIAEWLSDPSIDVENNFRMWAADGELVAYSDVAIFCDNVWIELDVRPDLRGGPLEDELLRWNVDRAQELAFGGKIRRGLS